MGIKKNDNQYSCEGQMVSFIALKICLFFLDQNSLVMFMFTGRKDAKRVSSSKLNQPLHTTVRIANTVLNLTQISSKRKRIKIVLCFDSIHLCLKKSIFCFLDSLNYLLSPALRTYQHLSHLCKDCQRKHNKESAGRQQQQGEINEMSIF